MNDHQAMMDKGLIVPGQTVRLHLGCGGTRMPGYVNIDFPPSSHNVMDVIADYEADLASMDFPEASVDEIRIHHAFEHFNRVVALGMLVRWHKWLKLGGQLMIETPDFVETSRAALTTDVKHQIALVRHLEGDQTADWGYHIGQWFGARFERTLVCLGYGEIVVSKQQTPWHTPPLHNVTVVCKKTIGHDAAASIDAGKQLLRDSIVAPEEAPTWQVWCEQLNDFLLKNQQPHTPAFARKVETGDVAGNPVSGTPSLLPQTPSPMGVAIGEQTQHPVKDFVELMLSKVGDLPPIGDIQGFNQRDRDIWIRNAAKQIAAGSSVLDVGAGSCPYRKDFDHTTYKTHDFKQYDGYIDPQKHEGLYGEMDYVSDIVSLPIPSKSFDVVLCTEVLEHVPEPIRAFGEMARILRPGGQMILTAPLGSGLHQEPFHFYGGYTPHWYKMVADRFGLVIEELVPNGTFFKHLAQECARVAWTLDTHKSAHGDHLGAVGLLFGELLPRYLFGLDDQFPNPAFTIGYHVRLRKP